MQVLVHTDNHIVGDEKLTSRVETEVGDALERFSSQVTRVEVYLNDLNGHKHGIDKRCLMEARVSGQHPVAVSHDAETIDEAVGGAAGKLEHSLEHMFGKLSHHKGRTSFGGDQEI